MLAQLPREPRRGDPPSSDQIAQIVRYLRALTNYVMRLTLGKAGGRASPDVTPFELTNASTTSPAALKVNIAPGYVNNVLPTDMNPTMGSTFTITETTYFWLKIVGSFIGADDVVTIESNTTGVIPAGTALTATSFTSFKKIGFMTVSGTTLTPTQFIRDNQTVVSFGNLIHWSP